MQNVLVSGCLSPITKDSRVLTVILEAVGDGDECDFNLEAVLCGITLAVDEKPSQPAPKATAKKKKPRMPMPALVRDHNRTARRGHSKQDSVGGLHESVHSMAPELLLNIWLVSARALLDHTCPTCLAYGSAVGTFLSFIAPEHSPKRVRSIWYYQLQI